MRKPILRALRAAGIWRRQTIHGFRRSFNDLLRQITSGEVVRSMTGHSSEAMTRHYSHVEAREKAEAVEQALRVVRGGRGET